MSWVQRLAGVEQELALLEDEGERRKVWRSVQLGVEGNMLAILAVHLAILWPGSLIAERAARQLGLFPLLAIVLLALFGTLSAVVSFRIRRRAYQNKLRSLLLARGIPVCLNCGYNLRGQTEPRCPECGREFDPAALGAAATMGEVAK